MSQSTKAALAEMMGLFFFTFIGAGAICVAARLEAAPAVGLLLAAAAHGLMMALNIAALGHVSGGHFNPAVSISLAINGRLGAADAVRYVAAQILGAALAAWTLAKVFPEFAAAAPWLGATLRGAAVSPGAAFWVELILTFILVSVVYGTAVHPSGPRALAPFAIGLAIAVDILAGGPLTGASMNPARTMGPALVTGNRADLWLYWTAPLIGGALAAWVFECWLMPAAAGTRGRRR
jgi:aquaporin TIP